MEKKIVLNNTIKNLKDELAASKLEHLGHMLRYKYGIKNTICYHIEKSTFEIIIDEEYWEEHDELNLEPITFKREELIEMDITFNSHILSKKVRNLILEKNV